MDSDPHADRMPCEDFVLRVDCREAFNNGPKYVRPGNLPGGQDVKTYDCGLLNFAASGTTDATTKLGELHVRYAGWFEKPILESTTSAPVNMQTAYFQSTAAEAGGASNVAKQLALATATNNGLQAVNTAGSILLPAGNYNIHASCVFLNTGSNMTACNLDLKVNGVSITTVAPQVVYSGPGIGGISGEISAFFASTGANPLTLLATSTYGAGVETLVGSVRITAV